MDDSVNSTIEKIKFQEVDLENELKERRELDATKVGLQRALREALTQAEAAKQESIELIKKTDRLRSQLEVEKLLKIANSQQVDACNKNLDEIRIKSDQGIAEVWELRSTLSESIHSVSDKCDIWALLMKPTCTEPILKPKDTDNTTEPEPGLVNEKRLQDAITRREQAQAERARLISEPETGAQFKRIKNALQYSLKMISNAKKTH